MKKNSSPFRAKTQLIAAMILFGTIGLFAKGIALPSSVISLGRGIIATLFLWLYRWRSSESTEVNQTKKYRKWLFISGALIGMNWIFFFESFRYTSVAIATLCYYCAPIFVIVASRFIFKERLTHIKIICIVVAMIGMILVSGVLQTSVDQSQLIGVGCGIIAAILYAIIILMNKRLTAIPALEKTVGQLFFATIVLVPYVLLTEKPSQWQLTGVGLLLLVILGVVHTGIAYTMYFGAIKYLPMQTTAIISYIDPVVAVGVSILILHEPIHWTGIVGAIMILVATFISERTTSNN